jgi:thiosulfate reductase cytochrome b subunit
MDSTYVLILIVVLMIILFSSGIAILKPTHLEFIRVLGRRRRVSRLIADWVLSAITELTRIRRAWIRMISPGGDVDS